MRDKIRFLLYVNRKLGFRKAEMSINSGKTGRVFRFDFQRIENGFDIYELALDFSALSCDTDLYYFFIILYINEFHKFCFGSKNNVDGELFAEEKKVRPFRFLVYDNNYTTPDWFKTGVMYHIFVDRFAKGSVDVGKRDDAIINGDWYYGKPQFGNKPGDFCSNNMFFGGTLYGVCEKLSYLKSLGVKSIYLSPIFEAYSNHKYDTGNYMKIDDMFGGEKAFLKLIQECEKNGIKVILDGVFNHTGSDSIYFNKNGRYKETGAYQSRDSKYCNWYNFKNFPDEYECWWGIDILPRLNLMNPETQEYFLGERGVVVNYLKKGISGFRLDVADELPEMFLTNLRTSIKTEKNDAVIIGEVWENAADKVAYSKLRRYFQGGQLDSVMNYPIKDAIVSYMKTGKAADIYNCVCDIYSSYPLFVSNCLMNILGTHDTERILTVLGTDRYKSLSNEELSNFCMSDNEIIKGKKLLKIASALQYTLPGVPSIFYGDEAGVQGGHDPFCRKTYPWGKEDEDLVMHYRKLGKLKLKEKCLQFGCLKDIFADGGVFKFDRIYEDEKISVVVNMSQEDEIFALSDKCIDLYSGQKYSDNVVIGKNEVAILKYI